MAFQYTSQTITNTLSTIYGSTSTTQYVGTTTQYKYLANTFNQGDVIGSNNSSNNEQNWAQSALLVRSYDSNPNKVLGNWDGKTDKYIGFKFVSIDDGYYYDFSNIPGLPGPSGDSSIHYGWICLSVGIDASSYTIKGWGYEQIPDKPAVIDFNVGIHDQELNDRVAIYSHHLQSLLTY